MIFKTSTLCVIIVYLTLSAVGAAKDRSLVDIKAELPRLFSEIKSLEMELTKTFKEKPVIKGDYIDRINSIEKELTSMISQVENLQNRIERIIRDGTNQLSDIRFRICELEKGCDINNLSLDKSLGEGAPLKNKNYEDSLVETHIELTIREKKEVQLVKDLLKSGDTENAIRTLKLILNTYDEGSSSLEVKFLLGESLMLNKEWKEAAIVYLDIYSSYSRSQRTAEALYLLGVSFSELGQFEQACLMFSQIELEHQSSPFRREAHKISMDLNCQ